MDRVPYVDLGEHSGLCNIFSCRFDRLDLDRKRPNTKKIAEPLNCFLEIKVTTYSMEGSQNGACIEMS